MSLAKVCPVPGAGDATGGAVARRYTKMWEMACLAGFLNGREVARRMVA